MAKPWPLLMAALIVFFSCKNAVEKDSPDPAPAEVVTPVTVSPVETGSLSDSVELNATASFLQNNYLKSTATGYVKTVSVKPGEYVKEGKVLFTIKTKESIAIGNTITSLDSTFKFSGTNAISSSTPGYVTQLNHQPGDYVQDGEQLAVISNKNSFAFVLNLPYELRAQVLNKKTVDLILPDGIHLAGTIGSVLPAVDSASQTLPVLIKVDYNKDIPQNLIAKVRIVSHARPHAQLLPKEAILSDEAQQEFWVMKLIDSVTAVKTIIHKGIELNNKVEILSPVFSSGDRVVVSGNYGMPDTAKISIGKK